jgi:hypothetical protein
MVRKSPQESSPVFPGAKALLQAMGKETGKVYPFE